jgi:hypothetical protein
MRGFLACGAARLLIVQVARHLEAFSRNSRLGGYGLGLRGQFCRGILHPLARAELTA